MNTKLRSSNTKKLAKLLVNIVLVLCVISRAGAYNRGYITDDKTVFIISLLVSQRVYKLVIVSWKQTKDHVKKNTFP